MNGWDDLPEPVEANPEACAAGYERQRVAMKRTQKRNPSFTQTPRKPTRTCAAGPVTLRNFSWDAA